MEFTKEQLIEHVELRLEHTRHANRGGVIGDLYAKETAALEISLAALNAEPVPGLFIKCTEIEPCPGKETIAQATPMADGSYHKSCFQLYTAPPAPIMPDELLSAMEEVLRISDRDHDAWNKAKAGIAACRAAMEVKAVSNSSIIPEVWVNAINELLDSDGSRGCFDAMDQRKARENIERLLAAVIR